MKRSDIIGAVIAWAIASAVVLGCTKPNTAHAEEPVLKHYSPKTAKDRDAFLSIFASTSGCMHEGAQAALMQANAGTRRGQIRDFVVKACGGMMFNFLTDPKRGGWTDIDAAMLITSMADDMVGQEIEWGRK